MISQLGASALGGGLIAALAALAGWVRAGRGGGSGWAAAATRLTLVAAGAACLVLEWALLAHDFSVRFVAENGGRAVPVYYTVTSLWSALEGSLLLWLLVLAGYAVLLVRRVPSGAAQLHPWAMAVVSAVTAAFFALALLAGNAFGRMTPVPADGPGPNPLLQDHPAMGVHPPLLYIGFVGMVVPFAYATAALLTGDTGNAWVQAARRWTLVAWAALTAGIVLGAWWSYAVLGWGGYWSWDPVENASVLPWLTATALLHSTMAQERRPTLRVWNISLAGATFLLVLVGTFLTRSGVLASVHSFTQSPIGPALLSIVVIVLAGFCGLVVWRADRLGHDEGVGAPVSRGVALLGNNLLLLCLAFAVLLGTLYPLLSEALNGDRLSVGPPYFNRMAPPLALAVVLLMAIGPLVRWSGDSLGAVAGRLRGPAAVGLLTVAVLGLAGARGAVAVLTCGLAALVVATVAELLAEDVRLTRRSTWGGRLRATAVTVVRRRRRYGGLLVHVGIALVAVAVAGSSAWSSSIEQTVPVGGDVSVAGVRAELRGLHRSRSGNVMSTQAALEVSSGSGGARSMRPTMDFYSARSQLASSPAIWSDPVRDVYITLVQVAEDGSSATLRLAVNPLVPWLWAGGGVLVVGALLAAWPQRRRRPGPEPQPARLPSRPVAAP